MTTLTVIFDAQSMGIAIWGMMELKYGFQTSTFQPDKEISKNPAERTDEPVFDEKLKSHYSENLRKLAWDCCRYSIDDRPTFEQVLKRIRKCTEHLPLRHAPPDHPDFGKVPWRFDKFAIGSDIKYRPPDKGKDRGKRPKELPRWPKPPPKDDDSDSDSDAAGAGGRTITTKKVGKAVPQVEGQDVDGEAAHTGGQTRRSGGSRTTAGAEIPVPTRRTSKHPDAAATTQSPRKQPKIKINPPRGPPPAANANDPEDRQDEPIPPPPEENTDDVVEEEHPEPGDGVAG
jgi:hypothetical protein